MPSFFILVSFLNMLMTPASFIFSTGCFSSHNGASERGYPCKIPVTCHAGTGSPGPRTTSEDARLTGMHPEPCWNQLLKQCNSEHGWLPPMRSSYHRCAGMWIKHRNGSWRRSNIPGFPFPSPKPNQPLMARMPLLVGSPPESAAHCLCGVSGLVSPHLSCLLLEAYPKTSFLVQKGLEHCGVFPKYSPTWQAVP